MSEKYQPDFTAVGAISEAICIMRNDFKFFTLLIIIYTVVSVAPYLYLFDGIDLTDPEVFLGQMQNGQTDFFAFYVVIYILYAVFIIYILDRTNAHLNDYSMDEYPYFARAVKCAVPVILIYIISIVLTGIGFVFLIIPGFIVIAGLYLSIPAKLAENINFLSAIQRSWELTKGHRMSIWGVLLIPLIPMLIISFGLLAFMMGDVTAIMSSEYLMVSGLMNGVFVTFFLVTSGVVYHQIRYETMDGTSSNKST